MDKKSSWVVRALDATTSALGSVTALLIVIVVVALWAASGPLMHFSDGWQLIINTATTIVTGIMVFVIQNTQNRSDRAMHAKLDALVAATPGAQNALVGIEEMAERDIKERQAEVRAQADQGV